MSIINFSHSPKHTVMYNPMSGVIKQTSKNLNEHGATEMGAVKEREASMQLAIWELAEILNPLRNVSTSLIRPSHVRIASHQIQVHLHNLLDWLLYLATYVFLRMVAMWDAVEAKKESLDTKPGSSGIGSRTQGKDKNLESCF